MIDVIVVGNHPELEKTLFSLYIQTIRDKIHVYIVSSSKHSFVSFFQEKFPVTEIVTKKKNIGACRQLGLNRSQGEYVLFMNAGDVLYDVFSLNNLYKLRTGYDAVIGGIMNAVPKKSNFYVVGNLYLRSYLEEHSVCFGNTNGSENGFQQLFFMTNPKMNYGRDLIYYRVLLESKSFSYYKSLIEDTLYAVSWAEKHDYYPQFIARLLHDVMLFYAYLFCEGKSHNKDLIKELGPIFSYYEKYKDYLMEEDIRFVSRMNSTNQKLDVIYIQGLTSIKV